MIDKKDVVVAPSGVNYRLKNDLYLGDVADFTFYQYGLPALGQGHLLRHTPFNNLSDKDLKCRTCDCSTCSLFWLMTMCSLFWLISPDVCNQLDALVDFDVFIAEVSQRLARLLCYSLLFFVVSFPDTVVFMFC